MMHHALQVTTGNSRDTCPVVGMQLKAIVTTSLGDTAYEQIADAIVGGVFAPGEKLTIRGLAESLGISSTPVRDAVKRLIAERALEQPSLRDIRVPVVSPEVYREIAMIRMEIEGLAAFTAATKASDAAIKALEGVVARNEKAILKRDWVRATALNKEFHFALADLAEMPTLRDILASLWLRSGPPVAVFYPKGGRAMIEHHHDVVAALRTRNAEAARAAIMADIGGVVADISGFLMDSKSRCGPEDAAPDPEARSKGLCG